MRNLILAVLFLTVAATGFLAVNYYLDNKNTGPAGLKIKSTPSASIFLNNKDLGRTPYDENNLKSGEYELKLIPESSLTNYTSWQAPVKLNPNTQTYVNHDLGLNELTSAGEIMTLEKISGNDSQIIIITSPDGAAVKFDGENKGNAQLQLKNIPEGVHTLSFSSPGFQERKIDVKTTKGYKLEIKTQLALASPQTGSAISPAPSSATESSKSATASGLTTGKESLKILDTPTGFLRVREKPSTASAEIGKVTPGETYPLLEESEGWYKIKAGDIEGWVSGKYAEKTS